MTLEDSPLAGKNVAVLVESEFIPDEIATYRARFSEFGANVELVSRLWGQPSIRFVSDVEEAGTQPETLEVSIDLADRSVDDYSAIVMAANYTSVRLRYFEPPPGTAIAPEHTQTAPAVRFFADAMRNPRIIKGALCHGLWILTPTPELLRGRRVICHEVVLADIVNAGALYVPPDAENQGVIVDGDLVTGRSRHEAELLVDAIVRQVVASSAVA